MRVFLEPIRKCADYKPAFGSGRSDGFTLEQFQGLYGTDVFYSLLGLDSPLVYAAHKAAGGLTSVYRQLGVASERLLREIIIASFKLSQAQASWSYEYLVPNGKMATHMLDARIEIDNLTNGDAPLFKGWLESALKSLGEEKVNPVGAVFEIRQGYKSADSKRQNADLRFGMRAYQQSLLPVFVLLSNQVSAPVVNRYKSDKMLVLTGIIDDDPTTSTFAFSKQVLNYDLLAFFERNKASLKYEVESVVAKLLTASD